MGAFGELFGFDGRVNRLGYLLRSFVAGAAITLLAAGGAALLAYAVRPGGAEHYELGVQALTVTTVLLVLWSTVALASRRLRDIGVEPAHVVPLYAALWVVNSVLLQPLSLQDPTSFGAMEIGWAGLQCFAIVPLLFWPGRDVVRRVASFDRPEPTAYLDWREHGG
jgi:uncharacterized membrane protein YhaH (DUF805 family)